MTWQYTTIYIDGYEFRVDSEASKFASEKEILAEAARLFSVCPSHKKYGNRFSIGWDTDCGGYLTSGVCGGKCMYSEGCIIIEDEE